MAKEYIEREAVLEEINEKIGCINFSSPYQDEIHLIVDGMERARDSVEEAPTADVVEVVRCKDCKYWSANLYGFICRRYSGIETKVCNSRNHYCSYGERKE